MAAAFDVGVPFLDQEVSDFIVAGRLGAQIDKVAGIIESKRWVCKAASHCLVCKPVQRGKQSCRVRTVCFSLCHTCKNQG